MLSSLVTIEDFILKIKWELLKYYKKYKFNSDVVILSSDLLINFEINLKENSCTVLDRALFFQLYYTIYATNATFLFYFPIFVPSVFGIQNHGTGVWSQSPQTSLMTCAQEAIQELLSGHGLSCSSAIFCK